MAALRFVTLLSLGASLLAAQDLRDYGRKVTEFSLANGLHFIVMERHQVPVVSFHTYVNAGSAQDPAGKTGLASLVARMAFEGTETIGTRNWTAEKKALEELDAAFEREEDERSKGVRADAGQLAILHEGVSSAVSAAYEQQNPNEYQRAIQENGGEGIDSHATPDSIETSYSLPSNRIELWFLLESQRLARPVFRNFFQDRQALQTDAMSFLDAKSPGRVRQSLAAAAFTSSAYRNPVLGWPSDSAALAPADVRRFFETYCGPGNMVIAIVGDVDPADARRLADRYFGPIPAKPRPPFAHTQELPQMGPKTVALWGDGEPQLLIGYKRPPEIQRDDAVFDAIAAILEGGLNQELVEEKRIAQRVSVAPDFPSARNVNLFVLAATPARGHTVEENRQAIDEMVTRLQSMPVDAAILAHARNILRGRFLRLLSSNREVAALLTAAYAGYGDWQRLLAIGRDYDRLTPEEIQRVALEYLIPAARTVAYLTGSPQPGTAAASVGGFE